MSIRVVLLPASDLEFAARVREALRAAAAGGHDAADMSAACEAELRRALALLRGRYPDVWIRRQDPLASVDGVETWYAFRDEALTASSGAGGPHG